jgi:hypothetical protein
MRGSYAPGTWGEDMAYLQAVLPVLAAAQNVALIDLKNEPDLDFAAEGRGTVLAWAATMAGVIRLDATGLPVTIGWSSAAEAGLLADRLDAISYHDYAATDGTAARLKSLRAAHPGKPVLVTEIGATSLDLAFGVPSSPAGQARDLARRLGALAEADGIFVWALNDFAEADAAAVGASPWVRARQSAFGLFGTDGSEKPAAAAVRDAYSRYLIEGDRE